MATFTKPGCGVPSMVGLQHTPRRPAIASLRDNGRAKEMLHAAKPPVHAPRPASDASHRPARPGRLRPARPPPTAPTPQSGPSRKPRVGWATSAPPTALCQQITGCARHAAAPPEASRRHRPPSAKPRQLRCTGQDATRGHPGQQLPPDTYPVNQRQRNRRGGPLLQRRQPCVIYARKGKGSGQEVQARARRHGHGMRGNGGAIAEENKRRLRRRQR